MQITSESKQNHRLQKKRARHLRYYRVHREPSAYLPERAHETGSSNVVRLPHLASSLESLPMSDRSTGSHRSRLVDVIQLTSIALSYLNDDVS